MLKSKIRVQFTTGQLANTSTTVALGPWHVGVVCSGQATPAGTGTDQATPSQSPPIGPWALCEAMVKTCKTYWDRSLNGVVNMTTPLRLLLALTQAVKDITSFGRSMRAMCQLLRCWLMSVLNMKCSSLDRSSSGELSVE